MCGCLTKQTLRPNQPMIHDDLGKRMRMVVNAWSSIGKGLRLSSTSSEGVYVGPQAWCGYKCRPTVLLRRWLSYSGWRVNVCRTGWINLDQHFRDQPPLFPRSDHYHDLLNHHVSDGSQAGPHPAWMERPMLFVSLANLIKNAKSQLKLSSPRPGC